MKFRFCGNLEAPDWILAEISVLSKISAVRVKMLASHVIQHVLGSDLDYAKVLKLTKGADLGGSDIKAAVAALRFVLTSAAKYDVSEDTLTKELQQLGLPAASVSSVVRPYCDCRSQLREALLAQSLRLPRLDPNRKVDWRVDVVLDSRDCANVNTPAVQLRLPVSGAGPANAGAGDVAFEVGADKFRVLYNELLQARKLMGDLES